MWRWIGLLLLLAALAVGVLLWRWSGRGGPRPPAGDSTAAASEPAPAGERPSTPALSPWAPPAAPTVSAMRYARFETLGVEDGLPSEKVTCVLVEGDDLSVGTDAGLALRRGGVWSVLGRAEGLSHPYVTSIARQEDTGDLWVSTLRGLNRVSGGTTEVFTQLNSGLMNNVVYHVVTSGHVVWAATAAGTSVLDTRTGTWDLYDHENSIMHEPWCYALCLGPERTWIGVWGGGVVELDHHTGLWREYRDPDKEMELDLLRDDGPIHDVTSFVAFDEGVLWQATYFGLSRYDGRRWRTYMARDTGLPGDFVNHVAARGRTAWISTDQGFGVFDGTTCVAYRRGEDGTCDVSVWRDGAEVERYALPTAHAHDYILWAQPGEQDVWLATGHGLSRGIAEDE